MIKAEKELKLVEVAPDDDTIAKQWNVVDDEGNIYAVKRRSKIDPIHPPNPKTTRELLEEILAKLP